MKVDLLESSLRVVICILYVVYGCTIPINLSFRNHVVGEKIKCNFDYLYREA